ncbi:MAG: MFS transporter [Nitrospiraceae bacterium]|nr:MFS transporter [Nitrospiraceae bacterium]
MRLNYPRTFLLSLAFFGLQVLFGVYNSYMPLLLQSGRPDFEQAAPVAGGFGLSAATTGFVMSLENLAAILILPFIGAISDSTASRLGRRKPFLLVGAPITALCFALLPLLLNQPLPLFMLVAFLFIIFVDVIRTPLIALMPDVTPSALRSEANGVVNLMGGVGGVLAFVVGGADGLDPALKARADFALSFGRMVWPHMLVRVMLAEQLYRAAAMLANHPYHRA